MANDVRQRAFLIVLGALAMVLILAFQAGGEARASGAAAPLDLGTTTPTPTSTPHTVENYTLVTQWGSFGSGDGQFRDPESIAVDTAGYVYVGDVNQGPGRIQKFTSSGTYVTQWVSAGPCQTICDEGLYYPGPWGMAVDGQGNIYATDGNGFVFKYTSTGTLQTQWTLDMQHSFPLPGMAVDGEGNVYVSILYDNIQKFTGNGTFVTQWGTPGSGPGQFASPSGMAVDRYGNVYVSDYSNNNVQKFSANGTFLTAWGSNGSGDGQFDGPSGVAVDSAGNVYVADFANSRIEKFSANGTFLTKWAANGPRAVAVDTAGNVYVVVWVGYLAVQVFAPGIPTQTATPTSTSTPTVIPTEVPAPDLIVSSVSAPPASVSVGGTFPVNDTTTNNGTLAAGPSRTGYFLWQQAGNTFVVLGGRGVPGLAGGQSSTGSGLATVPSTTAPGTYYLAVCANRGQRVSESNFANDCTLGSSRVQVIGAATPTPTPVPG